MALDATLLSRVDHLVYATPDLARTVADLESRLGLSATPGGRHPGRGTRNALFGLGPGSYLEVIGPDPESQAVPGWFGIDALTAPRIVTWAANGAALADIVAAASRQGVHLGAVTEGSRRRPDGTLLRWRFTDPGTVIGDGIVPFFIDWGASPHPADTLPHGLTLVDLEAEHPEPREIERMLSALGLALPVRSGLGPALFATLDGPGRRLKLG
jgi:hypothetical protein